VHWIKIVAKYVYDHLGKPVSITGIAMDISEKVETNHALNGLNVRLRKRFGKVRSCFVI